jgi:3,4-dihydroxy 2-butanone 4-phosphate synthase/GTP cyclohydrolase II
MAAVADPETAPFASIEEALDDIRAGKFVVVVDAPDRENEGDLTIAAEFATPEAVNFMATHGRGLICLCLTEERCDELGLHPMAVDNRSRFGTAFTVSIEAREGISTGISAADRRRRTTSSSPGTSSRCARRTVAFSSGRARPRRPSTSRVSPGCSTPASSAR